MFSINFQSFQKLTVPSYWTIFEMSELTKISTKEEKNSFSAVICYFKVSSRQIFDTLKFYYKCYLIYLYFCIRYVLGFNNKWETICVFKLERNNHTFFSKICLQCIQVLIRTSTEMYWDFQFIKNTYRRLRQRKVENLFFQKIIKFYSISNKFFS